MIRTVLVFAALMAAVPPDAVPGALLKPGMGLVYSGDGQNQPPWEIDSVRQDSALRPGSACAVIHLRRRPGAAAEESRLCLANDTLYTWIVDRQEWRVQRPVGPSMVVEFTRANGDRIRYETGERGEEQISGVTIPVVMTTVTTADSLGRPRRRLQERYAIGLATATGGVFEIPDTNQAGGWLKQQAFELVEIRTP